MFLNLIFLIQKVDCYQSIRANLMKIKLKNEVVFQAFGLRHRCNVPNKVLNFSRKKNQFLGCLKQNQE